MKKSKSDVSSGAPTFCELSIWKFYQWAAIVFPIVLMVSHWGIFYVFSLNTQEVLHYPEANEICIAWIYTFLFMVLPIITLPASYLYRWCNLFRIPFIYFLFINIERWYYGSWFCTNEMVDTHYILIYCIMGIYIIELAGLAITHRKAIFKFIKSFPFILIKYLRSLFHSGNIDQEKYDKLVSVIEANRHDETKGRISM